MRMERDAALAEYLGGRLATLRRSAYRLCGDWHEAEDLVQVVAVKLYRHWRRASAVDNLDGYVYRMLVRTWLDERRRPWRRARSVPDVPEELAPVEAGEPETRLVLARALAALPARQRAALVLRFWEDLGVAETAAAIGCSPASVKRYTALGTAALRELLPELRERSS
ncbi:MAG: sigma-70 family RNA polymerase sigma factor [Mycobacteriales bacterium]